MSANQMATLSPLAKEALKIYINELLKWNKKINLVSRKSISENFLWNQCSDSLTILRVINTPAQLLDIGTGNGFPALPCKIVNPDLNILCIEKNIKKASFLNYIVTKLQLKKIRIITSDLSLASIEYPVTHVTSKAFKSIQETIEKTEKNSKLNISKDAHFIFLKAANCKEEISAFKEKFKQNYKIIDIHNYSKPPENTRYLIDIQKCST